MLVQEKYLILEVSVASLYWSELNRHCACRYPWYLALPRKSEGKVLIIKLWTFSSKCARYLYRQYGVIHSIYHPLSAYLDLFTSIWLPYLDDESSNHLPITISLNASIFILLSYWSSYFSRNVRLWVWSFHRASKFDRHIYRTACNSPVKHQGDMIFVIYPVKCRQEFAKPFKTE